VNKTLSSDSYKYVICHKLLGTQIFQSLAVQWTAGSSSGHSRLFSSTPRSSGLILPVSLHHHMEKTEAGLQGLNIREITLK